MTEFKLEYRKELGGEILLEVLDIIRDEFYPPEEKIRKAFIKKVEEAEQRVKEGKFSLSKSYSQNSRNKKNEIATFLEFEHHDDAYH